jgi:hypothetical protein
MPGMIGMARGEGDVVDSENMRLGRSPAAARWTGEYRRHARLAVKRRDPSPARLHAVRGLIGGDLIYLALSPRTPLDFGPKFSPKRSHEHTRQ